MSNCVIRVCPICKKKFKTARKNHFYCSNQCWHNGPKGQKLRKKWAESSRFSAKLHGRSEAGKNYRRWFSNRKSLQTAIEMLGVELPKIGDIVPLYQFLLKAASKKKQQPDDGCPDAKELGVEFKVGRDYLRATQLLYDIFHGAKGKVRWFPSWDSLERMLERKGRDESLLFSSYLSYLKWCEKQMLNTAKRRRKHGTKPR